MVRYTGYNGKIYRQQWQGTSATAIKHTGNKRQDMPDIKTKDMRVTIVRYTHQLTVKIHQQQLARHARNSGEIHP